METKKNIDLNFVCRICLRKTEESTSLFSDCEVSKSIRDKILLCFQIALIAEDHLPSTICSGCVQELNTANNFRLKCIAFEERFSAYCDSIDICEDTQVMVPGVSIRRELDCMDFNTESRRSSTDREDIIKDFVKEPYFQCGDCHKILKTKASMVNHMISMHNTRKHVGVVTGSGINRRYHCRNCKYSTAHSQTLVNHMRRHNGQRPYYCKCGKSFTQSSTLAVHQKTHNNTSYFTCSTCGKQFKHTFSLKTHMRVHEPASISCSICPKKLKSQQALRDHLHRHNNIRNYSCEQCGATFVTFADLHNHKSSHSMDKLAECHFCGYKTRAKKNLIVHLKRHAGQKTFKCELCPVTVYTGSDLRRHRRVHLRDKPYQCPACSQKFSHSPSLNRHMKNIHSLTYKWGDSKPLKHLSVKHEEV